MDTAFVKVEIRGNTTYIAKSETELLNRKHQEHIAKAFKTKPNSGTNPTPVQQPASRQESALKSPNAGPRELPPPDKVPEMPSDAICVEKVVLVPSTSGSSNTSLQLKRHDGKTVEAFVRGQDPALQPGVWLVNTNFTQKENQGVIFHILDSYELAGQAAA